MIGSMGRESYLSSLELVTYIFRGKTPVYLLLDSLERSRVGGKASALSIHPHFWGNIYTGLEEFLFSAGETGLVQLMLRSHWYLGTVLSFAMISGGLSTSIWAY